MIELSETSDTLQIEKLQFSLNISKSYCKFIAIILNTKLKSNYRKGKIIDRIFLT